MRLGWYVSTAEELLSFLSAYPVVSRISRCWWQILQLTSVQPTHHHHNPPSSCIIQQTLPVQCPEEVKKHSKFPGKCNVLVPPSLSLSLTHTLLSGLLLITSNPHMMHCVCIARLTQFHINAGNRTKHRKKNHWNKISRVAVVNIIILSSLLARNLNTMSCDESVLNASARACFSSIALHLNETAYGFIIA